MTRRIRRFSRLRDFGDAADRAPLRRPSALFPLSIVAIIVSLGIATTPALASGSAGPAWKVTVTPNADYILPGSEYVASYKIEAENVGEEPTSESEPIVVEDVPPVGTTIERSQFDNLGLGEFDLSQYEMCPTINRCVYPEGPFKSFVPQSLSPGQRLVMVVAVTVPPGVEGTLEDVAKISGGGLPPVETSGVNTANAEPPFGTLHFDASITSSGGEPYIQAGGHPYELSTEFNFETYSTAELSGYASSGTVPMRDPRDIAVDLPPGLVANPQAVPHCTLADYFSEECARPKVAIGDACIRFFGWTEGGCRIISPILNLQPEHAFPAEFGILIGGAPFILVTTQIRTGGDYGATAVNVAGEANVSRIKTTFWGVPADPGHDALRGKECQHVGATFQSVVELERQCEGEEGVGSGGGSAEVEEMPYLTMPTECSGNPLPIVGRYDSWQVPGEYTKRTDEVSAVERCNVLSFQPTIEAGPTTNLADAPSGFEFHLHVPQHEDPEGVATPELKEAAVRFPKGLSINPASGDGLGTCSEAQIGLHSDAPASCPNSSELGSVEVNTPLLHEPLLGFLYLATPRQNPAGSLLAGYMSFEGQGVLIKLAGKFETDPATGQITAKFLENPQLPFEDLKLNVFGGARGALRTPAVCGAYETTSELTPFSAPESGPPATPSAEFETEHGPTGGECPYSETDLPNSPRFHAGTESSQAGIYSPFALKLVRDDGTQEVTKVDTTLPKGLVGRLAGTSYCSDAGIAQAKSREHEGGGAEEQASPSCPTGSEVGTVDVGAGAGPTPLYVHGRAYLAGPYKGAPLSLAIITPAVAGPFDLGTVVVRAALHVDPETTQIHAVSDPIPTILEGIPLDVRSITLKLSKPDFTLNPTSCEESFFTGSALSILNVAAPLSQRFQVGGCPALAFKPKLSLQLKGGTKRTKHPALTAVLKMPPGDANIAAAQVTLPHSELLDQGHIGTICTKVQFAANACPAKSVYGQARAFSPLLDQPLEGPVYLRSSSHKLPDLVADLNGQIQVVLAGRVDAVHERLRTSFEAVPDAPVSKFVLQMQGGKKGLVVNQENLCGKHAELKATALFSGQNGKSTEFEPRVGNTCKRHQPPPPQAQTALNSGRSLPVGRFAAANLRRLARSLRGTRPTPCSRSNCAIMRDARYAANPV